MDITEEKCYNEHRRVPFEELTFADDFMFCKVMQDEKLCKELLEILLGVKIEKIVYHEDQKVFRETIAGKGMRLDVYVKDENHTIYDIEMQTTDTKELPKRTRYYHSSIDRGHLEAGEKYRNLKDTFVIFICTFDLFGKGFGKYTFETICKESYGIRLQDGRHTIFVNATGVTDDQELQEFLDYLKDGTISNSSFIRDLDRKVRKNSTNAKWKEEYNMLLAKEEVLRDEGRIEGREEQKQEMYLSYTKLIEAGVPFEQILSVVKDKEDFTSWLKKQK